MAYRVIGSLSVRSLHAENICTVSAFYCGSCKRSGTRSSVGRSTQAFLQRNQPFSSHYSSLSLHDYRSSFYYKTNNLICDNIKINSSTVPVRFFHISSRHYEKDKSVVEKAVKIMKEKKEKLQEQVTPTTAVEVPKRSLMETIKHHAKYYKDGFVLFSKELRIACSYLWRFIVKGETLSRRELRQLNRTSADVFRMIPYLIFLIIPFFELLIPVYLKLFPNALPSTFGRNENKSESKLKEQLKRKQEIGKFLQETLEKTSLERNKKKDRPSMVQEFTNFLGKVRSGGMLVSNEEIVYFSKLFEDEITIDSLSRQQLQALCKVLEIKPIGTDHMLRFQLDVQLRRLLVDDKLIAKEGVGSLNIPELQQANRARGMRALGVDENRLRMQLQQWLDLHLNQKVPTSLLLLSRALYLPEELSPVEQLHKTIQSLPQSATDEATMKVAEISGEVLNPETKMNVLKHEQQAIEKESKDKMEAKQKQIEEQTKKEEEKAEAIAARVAMEAEKIQDSAVELEIKPGEEIKGVKAEEELSSDDLQEIESVIENIAMERKFNIKEAELQDLKEDVDEYKEDLEDLKSVILASGGEEEDIKESKSAKKLVKRVDKVVKQLDMKINELHKERMDLNEQIVGQEKKLEYAEMSQDDEQRMIKTISEKKKLVITINDMLLGLRKLQKVPDEDRLQRIVQVLDEDRDGIIDARHVLKVLKLIGQENVKLETTQVTQLIDLCKKEMLIEEEEKQKEKEEKVQQKEKEQREKEQIKDEATPEMTDGDKKEPESQKVEEKTKQP